MMTPAKPSYRRIHNSMFLLLLRLCFLYISIWFVEASDDQQDWLNLYRMRLAELTACEVQGHGDESCSMFHAKASLFCLSFRMMHMRCGFCLPVFLASLTKTSATTISFVLIEA